MKSKTGFLRFCLIFAEKRAKINKKGLKPGDFRPFLIKIV